MFKKTIFRPLFLQIRSNYTNTSEYRIYRNAIITQEHNEQKKKDNQLAVKIPTIHKSLPSKHICDCSIDCRIANGKKEVRDCRFRINNM